MTALGLGEEGEEVLTFMSLEFKFLHLKSQCKMLIGVDYIWHHGYTTEMHGVNRDSICEGCKEVLGFLVMYALIDHFTVMGLVS